MFFFDSRMIEVCCFDVKIANLWLIKVMTLSFKLAVVFGVL